MLQVGHVQHQGTGGYVAVGPAGVALVEPDLVQAAHDAVSGHTGIEDLVRAIYPTGKSMFLLDLTQPAPVLSLFGALRLLAWRYGETDPEQHMGPIVGASIDPQEFVALEVEIMPSVPESGPWLPLWSGAAKAAAVRLGHPGRRG